MVTKDRKDAGVYKASVGTTVLTRIADFGLGGDEVVTGADVSPDGTRVVVVSKARAHEMTLPAGAAFDGVWRQSAALWRWPNGSGQSHRLPPRRGRPSHH